MARQRGLTSQINGQAVRIVVRQVYRHAGWKAGWQTVGAYKLIGKNARGREARMKKCRQVRMQKCRQAEAQTRRHVSWLTYRMCRQAGRNVFRRKPDKKSRRQAVIYMDRKVHRM